MSEGAPLPGSRLEPLLAALPVLLGAGLLCAPVFHAAREVPATIEIVLVVRDGASASSVDEARARLSSVPSVASVTLRSREDTAKELASDRDFAGIFDALSAGPLPVTLRVRPRGGPEGAREAIAAARSAPEDVVESMAYGGAAVDDLLAWLVWSRRSAMAAAALLLALAAVSLRSSRDARPPGLRRALLQGAASGGVAAASLLAVVAISSAVAPDAAPASALAALWPHPLDVAVLRTAALLPLLGALVLGLAARRSRGEAP